MEQPPASRLYYPYLFALYPILYLFSSNLGNTLPAADVVPSLVGMLLLCRLLQSIARRAYGDPDRSALFVAILLFFFFTYLPIHIIVNGCEDGTFLSHRIMVPLLGLFFAGSFLAIRRLRDPAQLRPHLNVFVAIFCAVALVSAAYRYPWPGTYATAVAPDFPVPAHVAHRPDIYLIVLDAYLRNDFLLNATGFDNSKFYDQLAGLGFNVARDSRSNYPNTTDSFASFLNGGYVSDTLETLTRYPADLNPLRHLILDNAVTRFLRRLDYRIVAFESILITNQTNADRLIPYRRHFNDFEYQLLSFNTPVNILLNTRFLRFPTLDYWAKRSRVQSVVDRFADGIAEPSPKFVFCHLPTPHKPYVFKEDGGWSDLSRPYAEIYSGEYRYANRIALRMVEQILASPGGSEAWILLISDHGRWQTKKFYDVERVANLVAVRMPRDRTNDLPNDLTLVNLFRFAFSRIFGADLPLLENHVFRCLEDGHYKFAEVK